MTHNKNLTKLSTKYTLAILACLSFGFEYSGAQDLSVTPALATSTLDFRYIKIIDSCNSSFGGTGCVAARSKPTRDSKKVARLRDGIVLRVTDKVGDGINNSWYKISFSDETLHYEDRVATEWYVNARYATSVVDVSPEVYNLDNIHGEHKKIVVDISEQSLYAYENDKLYFKTRISTGLKDTPTIPGEYFIMRKTPSRYMQGPDKWASTTPAIVTATTTGYYDLPGVPWTMYFDEVGSAIHGAYWHNSFGRNFSHGCVNLNLKDAERLYRWAESGTNVIIKK